MKQLISIAFILLILLSSCGSSKKTTSVADKKNTEKTSDKVQGNQTEVTSNTNISGEDLDIDVVKYIARYRNIAKKEMKEYGIPASITLAQGILESQSGKSRLAVEGNNHFGIKCHKDWQGKKILHDDDDNQECFRKYLNPDESYKDHSKFLAYRKRYAFLFRLPKTDYEAWARSLKKAGYATDPSYPDKLIYIIEKYRLNQMDKEVLDEMSVKVNLDETTSKNKKKKFIYEVKEGETLFTIARKFGIPVKDIQSINNLNDFDIYEGQILVLTGNEDNTNTTQTQTKEEIVKTEQADTQTVETVIVNDEPKQNVVTDPNLKPYVVKQGETLFSIAKTCRVDIDDLKKANNLTDNNIDVGSTIYIPLDKVKPETPQTKPETVVQTEDEKKYHIVQPGETLYRIHINYKVPISKLRKWNHIKGNYIKVGQKLRVK